MTDKQIIEHKLLYEGLDWSVGVDGMFINPKQIPYTNCLYELALACDSKSKQLKAKEQECEELNKEIHNLNSTINFIKVTEHSAINKYNKLKQALTEIKEIAKHFIEKGLEPQSVEHQLKLRGKEELAKIILQKCEVLEQ